jgi:hypothetical protein
MDHSTVNASSVYYEEIQHENSVLEEDQWFDLQPIEKKLCAYSLGLGILFLFVCIVLFEVI